MSEPRIGDAADAAAVEFALVLPVLLALVFGIISYGCYLGLAHCLQAAASESVRASVAGLDEAERESIAVATARSNLAGNPLIDPTAVTISTGPGRGGGDVFTVTLQYDLSRSELNALSWLFPMPTRLSRAATIRRGGL